MVKDDPEFFKGVDGVPLHLAIKAIKPTPNVDEWLASNRVEKKAAIERKGTGMRETSQAEEGALLKDTSAFENAGGEFLVPPREVLWSCLDYGERFVLRMPDIVVQELVDSAKSCFARGIDSTNYMPGDVWPLTQVKRFGQDCANRLMRKHGNLVVQGLDIDALADSEAERERLAKLCYYILMTCTGNIKRYSRASFRCEGPKFGREER